MRKLLAALALGLMTITGASAASPEQEKAFVDAYKTAFDSQNADGIYALMFTDGAIEMAVEFYKMMATAEFGAKAEITLEDLTAEDEAMVAEVQEMPDGSKAVLLPKPYKKLVIKVDTSDANGTSSSTSTAFVAEVDGKLGIAMPHPAP